MTTRLFCCYVLQNYLKALKRKSRDGSETGVSTGDTVDVQVAQPYNLKLSAPMT